MSDYVATGQDAVAWFLRRCGQLFPNDATIADAQRIIDAKIHLNERYWDVCASKPYRWARRDPAKQFTSVAKQTVTATDVSTADPAVVTLSATIATSQAGRKFYLDGDGIPHRIQAHTAGTASLTLVTAYTGTLTSGSGVIYQDELTIAADILAYPLIYDMHGNAPDVQIIDEAYFLELRGRNVKDGAYARYVTFISDGKVRIGPHTTARRLFECAYNYRPDPLTFDGTATDVPIIPLQARTLPALFALRDLMVDRRDERVKLIQGEIEEKAALVSGTEITLAKPRGHVPPGKRVML